MGLAKVIRLNRRQQRRQQRRRDQQTDVEHTDAKAEKARSKQRSFAKGLQRKAINYQLKGPLEARIAERRDTWKNMLTKLGAPGDKRLGGVFGTDRMVDLECEDLWRGSDMAARAVETVPDAIERAGFEILIQSLDKKSNADTEARSDLAADVLPPKQVEAKDESAKELAIAMSEQAEELNVAGILAEALKAERGYGGSAILPGIRDGVSDLRKPLNLDRIESVDWLDVLTPLELIPYQWYEDPYDAKFGQPELYWMQRIPTGNTGAARRIPIHESRLIRFGGIVVSRRQVREHWGWGDSVLVRMNEVLRDFDTSWQGAAVLISDFAQMVISIKGLAEAFANGENDLLVERARAMDEGRSIAKAILVDSEETAERQSTPVTGLADLLDRFCNRLAAAARMPVTLLMGQAPAGLNATGDSDIRNFLDVVAADRKIKLTPKIRQLFKMLFAARRGPAKGKQPAKWSIDWGALWQLTDVEEATRRKSVAETDKIYVDGGVLLPEEVAKSRFSGVRFSAETQLDRKLREAYDAQVAAEAEQQAAQLQAQLEAGGGGPAAAGSGSAEGSTSTTPAGKPAKKSGAMPGQKGAAAT